MTPSPTCWARSLRRIEGGQRAGIWVGSWQKALARQLPEGQAVAVADSYLSAPSVQLRDRLLVCDSGEEIGLDDYGARFSACGQMKLLYRFALADALFEQRP
jgi:hypothetical protein